MPFFMPSVRRRFRPLGFLFLAAMLAFGQHQAALHLLGHSIEQIAAQDAAGGGNPSHAPESVCAKCLALAHLDHAVDSPVPATIEVVVTHGVVVATSIASIDVAHARPYESRAPPAFS